MIARLLFSNYLPDIFSITLVTFPILPPYLFKHRITRREWIASGGCAILQMKDISA
jgi:hypothetical protein